MLNEFALGKSQYESRKKFRCVHRHNGLSKGHPNCYDQFYGLKEKIGFYDIESSNLTASFGIVLSYCILSEDGELIKRVITPEELRSGEFDKELLKDFCIKVRQFDRIVGWYSGKFDAPFLRTRCIYHGLDFPLFKEIKHTDAYLISKYKLKMHSNRLEAVANFFNIPAKGHRLTPEVWLKCLSGNTEALDFVLTHNIEDVETLRNVFNKIKDYTRLTDTSI